MLKNILNLDGAQQLSKNEQKSISGGRPVCTNDSDCNQIPPAGTIYRCVAGGICKLELLP